MLFEPRTVILPEEKLESLKNTKSIKFRTLGTKLFKSDKSKREWIDKAKLLFSSNEISITPDITLVILEDAGYLAARAKSICVDHMKKPGGISNFLDTFCVEELNCSGLEFSTYESLFAYCHSIVKIDLTGHKIDSLSSTFYDCINLREVNFDACESNNLKEGRLCFGYCMSLEDIDFKSLDLNSLTDAEFMFGKCGRLEHIDFGRTSFNSVKNTKEMFTWCTKLSRIDINTNGADKILLSLNTIKRV